MIVPAQLAQKHNLYKPYLDEIESRVRERVFSYCSKEGFAFVGRLKDTESLFEKIETGRFDKWTSLDDLYACAIVIPFLDVEKEAINWLEGQFEVLETRTRGSTQKDPTVFRFDATRIIAKLRNSDFIGETNLTKISFEIQIRTAFEHAWSVATHTLAYKGETVDWGRLRLAAQLKASVEQLDMLVLGFDGAANAIYQQNWPDVVVRAKIEQMFRGRFNSGALPAEVKPNSWMRFCENVQRLILATTTKRYTGHAAQVFVEERLLVIEDALVKIGANFPRSLSPLQFCLGVLAESGHAEKLTGYVPFISDELRSLYPKTKGNGSGFDLESAS